MHIAIVTDSTAYLSAAEVEQYHISVIPIPVILDGVVYDEGKTIDTPTFYAKLRTSKSFPSTSQPPLGEVMKLYENLANEGYDTILSIHLASTISGFYQTLVGLAPTMTKARLVPYDSHITVKLMGYLVIAAARLAAQGKSVEEITQTLDKLRATMDEVFIVNDLQNLVRGGRLSNASAFIGGMLKIKPLLTFNDEDKIVAFEKVRSIKKAYSRAETIFKERIAQVDYPVRALVIHANDPEEGQRWLTDLSSRFPNVAFELNEFGPVVGTHLGEKAIAIAWMADVLKTIN
ncbi:DegV family protein [Schleiferilactobacillus perolens]|uniref:DegV family protein n=1 Tax=Schleiferilactobacillus perolens TaxID=100468 RepID=UPI00070B91E0|nr:DegV family protein [Schleiferilactobacillus perolens]